MNVEMLRVIDFALNHYEKISAFKYLENELYIKVFTKKSVDEVTKEFAEQCFQVIEFDNAKSNPTLIKTDIEPGVEFIIVFA